ncbi:fasciclin domain-containing protein [Halalkalibaculum sp. DA3122]|uniref:fasciclin domain-containing protein n=1 Tax=unclassified Halalkalibaculum TaxID=2964617 RepID=UPI00375537C5
MGYCHKRGFLRSGALTCILALVPLLLPAQNVFDVLSEQDEASIFVNTIEKAGLNSTLNSGGPYTIFAPTNTALEEMQDRLNRANSSWAERFVMNHLLTGMATQRQIIAMSKVPTMGGLVLTISVDNENTVKINEVTNNVTIVKPNIRAQNGVIHLVDGVLEE